MKTIKTITTALLLLFTVTAFSQTKEETLEWLNQNSSYCYVYYKDDGEYNRMSYTFYENYFIEHYIYGGRSKSQIEYKLYYKDIFIQDLSKLDESNESRINPPITSIKIPVSKYYSKGGDDVSYEEQRGASGFHFYYETDQPNARKNLEKVLRAIMHMAKLHGAEPYKDLFGE